MSAGKASRRLAKRGANTRSPSGRISAGKRGTEPAATIIASLCKRATIAPSSSSTFSLEADSNEATPVNTRTPRLSSSANAVPFQACITAWMRARTAPESSRTGACNSPPNTEALDNSPKVSATVSHTLLGVRLCQPARPPTGPSLTSVT